MRGAREGAGTPSCATQGYSLLFRLRSSGVNNREGARMPPASTLGEVLARYTREGELYEKLPGDRVRCFACGHRCLIPPGQLGVCKVRFNEAGNLRVPFGYVGAL